VQEMCRVLGVSRSGFYKWLNHAPSKRAERNQKLKSVMQEIYKDHEGRIGSPKMKVELVAKGYQAGKNRIADLMRMSGLRAKTHRRFRVVTTDSNHDLPVAENLLNREFNVSQPGQVLVSDITYVKTKTGWVYLTVFIDLFSRIVAGWAVSSTLKTDMVLTALNRAAKARCLQPGAMIHSDRGCQYASEAFRAALKELGLIQSMSRKGNCWDNAVAESFFRIYKTEMAYHYEFKDLEDVRHKTFEYIECYYNRKRRHGTLGYLTPVEFENQFRKTA
jgi:putative transposase